jgi:DNA-binding NtrC family response regulator
MSPVVPTDGVAETIARVTLDRRGTEVVEIPVGSEEEAAALARTIADRVVPLGFVPLRANVDLTDERKHQLAHRHLALLAFAPADNDAVLSWLRMLSAVSPRAHLVVSFRVPKNSPDGPAARPDARLLRAQRFSRRGRRAQAERWYRAALESARRRGDVRGQVVACRKVVEQLTRRDDWDNACRLTRFVLDTLRDTTARAELAALLSGILTARAELGQAEAALSAAVSELAIAGLPLPSSLDEVRAELRFWQGRLGEAAAATRSGPATVRGVMVAGAIAFIRRDANELSRCATEAAELRSLHGGFCEQLFSMLHASLTRDCRRARDLFTALERRAQSVACPRLIRLGRALATEALVVSGFSPPVVPLTGCQASARMPALDRLFLDWQRAVAMRERELEQKSAVHLARAGARVVETWRWGCSDMQLVHAIPILLQVVQDAEDDLATLAAAGSWIRREAGADAVAFLDPDRAVVFGDGWTTGDTAEVCADHAEDQPAVSQRRLGGVLVVRGVRYAGAMTGVVAVRGPDDRRQVLIEAASTAAALCGPALRARIDLVKTMRVSPGLAGEILGCSPAIVALREAVARAAVTPFPVLVEGESGTGKELVARAIHRLSPRRDRRFVAVNCAAFTDELVEAELFGHTRGAFTGAIGSRTGLFEDAHGGSLFLDEVGELSPRAQAKLLRVLQEREVRRVGENASRPVDVRVVAATNRPLSDAIRQATFREDLLFRLAVVRLRVPPLRDRIEDIPLLAHASWRLLASQAGKRALLGPDAIAQLCRYSWPGNVRELQNAMAALLVTAPDRGRIGARHVSHVLAASSAENQAPSLPLHRTRANFERTAVAGALARHGGRRTLAARELGLTRQGLTKAMKRLGLADGAETGVA